MKLLLAFKSVCLLLAFRSTFLWGKAGYPTLKFRNLKTIIEDKVNIVRRKDNQKYLGKAMYDFYKSPKDKNIFCYFSNCTTDNHLFVFKFYKIKLITEWLVL